MNSEGKLKQKVRLGILELSHNWFHGPSQSRFMKGYGHGSRVIYSRWPEHSSFKRQPGWETNTEDIGGPPGEAYTVLNQILTNWTSRPTVSHPEPADGICLKRLSVSIACQSIIQPPLELHTPYLQKATHVLSLVCVHYMFFLFISLICVLTSYVLTSYMLTSYVLTLDRHCVLHIHFSQRKGYVLF